MGGTKYAPCITPASQIYNFEAARPFFGGDMLAFQQFPVDKLKLTHLSETVPLMQTMFVFELCY